MTAENTRKAGKQCFFSSLLVMAYFSMNSVLGDIGCLDNQGNPVDWFVVLKMPLIKTSEHDTVKDGVGQLYIDANHQTLNLLDKGIDAVGGHAVYNTLQQIYSNYKDQKVAYLMYNDQVDKKSTISGDEASGDFKGSNFGHTKGDLCFQHKSTGFWLVHSVPHFCPKASAGYGYPSSGKHYGQSFLCVTYGYDQLNIIAQQMLYNHPQLFDLNVPTAFSDENPYLSQLVEGGHITKEPWNNKVTLKSNAGLTFTSFAKSTNYGKDLYEWVANDLQSSIYVESWQHNETAPLPSICDTYKVTNVADLKYLDIPFSEREDHSKWAVTYGQQDDVICIGDINREAGQLKRGGGTVCGNLPSVAKAVGGAVVDTKPCQTDSPEHDEM